MSPCASNSSTNSDAQRKHPIPSICTAALHIFARTCNRPIHSISKSPNRCYAGLNREDDMKDRPLHYAALAGHAAAAKVRGRWLRKDNEMSVLRSHYPFGLDLACPTRGVGFGRTRRQTLTGVGRCRRRPLGGELLHRECAGGRLENKVLSSGLCTFVVPHLYRGPCTAR